MTPQQAGAEVALLAAALRDPDVHERVPAILEALLSEDRWRLTHGGAGWIEHDDVTEWITEEPPHGLGTTVEHLVALCAGHPAVVAALEAAASDGPLLSDLDGMMAP